MRHLLDAINAQFARIDRSNRSLLSATAETELFIPLRSDLAGMGSIGEYLLRSAAMVEKTFGGITTRLWDDPFEWTLPEALATRQAVSEYFDEVAAARERGMRFLQSDDDLQKRIPAPAQLRTISEIFMESLHLSAHYQGRAFAAFQRLSNSKLPRM